MKQYMILLFLSATFSGFAQEYSIVPDEPKTYFTNAWGYLRGIRIDSTRTHNGIKTYHLFHTARIPYGVLDTYADTTGGSWQGKTIVEDTLGNTMVATEANDTVFIKTTALLNESWLFYTDTTDKYYEATVTAIDTATFADIFDTVKTIQLTAFNGGTMDVNDTLNNLEIKLSQHHGWMETIDLYLFPYKPPGGYLYDCYLYQSLSGSAYGITLNKKSLIFKRVAFAYLKNRDINNRQLGDVFFSTNSVTNASNGDTYTSYRDSVVSKSENDSFYNYGYTYKSTVTNYSMSGPPTKNYNSGERNTSGIKTGVMYGDTTKMPEELGCAYYYYYLPEDSSFCYVSPVFAMLKDKIINNRFGGGGTEPTYSYLSAKEGIGTIINGQEGIHPDLPIYSFDMWWAKKGGNPCNARNEVVSIKAPVTSQGFDLKTYPNPSAGLLYIDLPYPTVFTITIYNATGGIVHRQDRKGGQSQIDATGFTPGCYFLKYADKERTIVKKIMIRR